MHIARLTMRAGLPCLLAGLFTTAVMAQRPSDGPEVTIRTVDPEPVHGRLVALSLARGAAIQAGTEAPTGVETENLVRIVMARSPARARARGWTLSLTHGDRLFGRLVGGGVDTLLLETTALGKVSVPLNAVETMQSNEAATPAHLESAAWFDRAHATGDSDRFLLTNGDVIEGFITAIDAEGVSIEGTSGETRLEHRVVVSAHFASSRPKAIEGPFFILSIPGTGRLSVTRFELTDGTVTAKPHFGGEVTLHLSRIARIDVVGGRWRWLSHVRPSSHEHTPMLSLPWGFRKNRNVLGGPMTVAGETFDFGVGVHSRSRLTYDLGGAYRSFVTSMGIDDDSGARADVTVSIMVDGKRRLKREHLRRGTLAGPVRVDVKGAQRLELLVDFGDNGDIQDRFDWVEAALIR